MLVEAGLVFFGPAFSGFAVLAEGCFAAELAHDERFVPCSLPLHIVGVFGTSPIPTEILVQSEHIKVLAEWIAEHARVWASFVHMVHCRSDQPGGVELASSVRKLPQECQPLRFHRSLVGK